MSLFAKRKATNYLVVHCTASPPSLDVGVKEVRQWHKQRGFTDIGYHFVIRRDGRIETGRALDTVGAHVQGHNADSVGISLVGGVDAEGKAENNFTAPQFAALAEKLRELKALYPRAKVLGHRDFAGVRKACPSFDVATWLKETGVFDTPPVVLPADTAVVTITAETPTFFSIAKKYGVTVADLAKANPHLEPGKLRLGQLVKLP